MGIGASNKSDAIGDRRASPAREVFTDRVHELNILAQAAADLECVRPHHVVLFHLRRFGKTLLCKPPQECRPYTTGYQLWHELDHPT